MKEEMDEKVVMVRHRGGVWVGVWVGASVGAWVRVWVGALRVGLLHLAAVIDL